MGDSARVYRFGVFLFEVARLELSRAGRPVRLQPQPARVLALLLARAGRLVTRDELRHEVWSDDTFVDFDRGLNFCIAQIRAALSDDAGTPRYIRTVPKMGYEFIFPVDISPPEEGVGSVEQDHRPRHLSFWHPRSIGVVLAVLALLAAVGTATHLATKGRAGLPLVAVARFDNETGDPGLTRFADNLTDTVVEQLADNSEGQYGVVGNAAILRRPREQRDLSAIAASLRARYVILGQVQRDDRRLRVLAHLIRLPEQTHITVSRTDGVSDATLTIVDDVAGRIARAFAPRLRESGLRITSHALTTH